MPALIGAIGSVVNMNQAVNGNALGNPAYQSQLDVASAVAGQANLIANYNASLASSPSATLATTVLNNMFVTTAAGVSAANVAALNAALTQAFAAYPAFKGQVISNLANLLGGLEGEASWGPAALAFNNQAAANFVYSTNTANTFTGNPSNTQTFTLTTNIDTFNGTSGNDAFTGVFGAAGETLNAGDTVNGGTGTDTLTLTTSGGAASSIAATIRGIETILIRGLVTSAFEATSVTGAERINVIDSISGTTATVQGLSSLSTVIGATGAGSVTATFTNATLSGTADTARLSVTGAGVSNTAAAGLASNAVTAALTVSTSGIEGYSVETSGTNTFSVTGSTTAATDGATLTITGNGSNTITASALTQASLYDMSASTGTNTLNLAGALTTSDTVRGGTGTDTLRTNNATTVANLTVTGVETLRLNTGSSTGNLVFASAANNTTIRVDGDTAESGTQTLTGIGDALRTIQYVGDALTANNTTAQQFNNLTISNSLTGTETVAITIGNGGISNSGGYTLRTLTAVGLENINITANDLGTSAVATFTGITSTTLGTIAVTAAIGGVDLGTLNGVTAASTSGNLTLLNFSGVVGTAVSTAILATNTVGAGTVILGATGLGGTTITLGAETSTDSVTYTGGAGVDTVDGGTNTFTGVMVVSGLGGADILTGGSGADTLDGGAAGDTLVGNLGADTLIGGEGSNTITGGGGNDTINIVQVTSALDNIIFDGPARTSAASTANMDTITGFTSADRMTFGSTFLGGVGGGSNTYVSGTLFTTASNPTPSNLTAQSGRIILVSDALTGASGSAAIATLVSGASGFASAGSQTAVIVAADGSNAYVWFVNDTFDGNATDVTSTDVVLIGTLSGTTSVAAFGATNFNSIV